PAVALEEAPILAVAGGKVECQLERLAGHPGEREVLEEGHPLVVVVAHFLAVFDQLEPLARPPPGHGRERLAARIVRVRPKLQAYGRADVHPVYAAVGEPGRGCADGFADREIDVVGWDAKLSRTHPDLRQPGI